VDEATWMVCADPAPMLEFLRDNGRASERQLRLFACACLRRGLPFRKDDKFRKAVETTEEYADGQTSKAALKRARQAVRAARHTLPTGKPEWSSYWLAEVATTENAYGMVANEIQRLAAGGILKWSTGQQAACCTLVRDIMGNPFRPLPPINPFLLTWNSNLVRTLAQAAYDDRLLPSGRLDPDRLAILADALTDAGCTDTELLEHLRGEGPHLRGCYAVDCILGKS
jgi:hypothetical protein